METMTQTNQMTETKAVQNSQIRAGQAARMRDLTPAQRRAVMFAQQQVLRARAAKKAKDERQSALSRMWQEEDAEHTQPHATIRKHEEASQLKDVSLREAIGHVLRDLRTRDSAIIHHETFVACGPKSHLRIRYPKTFNRGKQQCRSKQAT